MNVRAEKRVTAAGILLMTRSPSPQFLLLRHADRWDLPKGHCDPGEDFRDTALRETQEETGIEPNELALDPNFHFDLEYPVQYRRSGDRSFTKEVRYFLGWLESKPDLVLTEHQAAQWFDWNPPHRIQDQTVDPLLAALAKHLEQQPRRDETN